MWKLASKDNTAYFIWKDLNISLCLTYVMVHNKERFGLLEISLIIRLTMITEPGEWLTVKEIFKPDYSGFEQEVKKANDAGLFSESYGLKRLPPFRGLP